MFYALREALRIAHEEGLEARFERHRTNHLALVAGVEAMGLQMHVSPPHRLWTLNTVRLPSAVDDVVLRKDLLDRYGIEVLGGFGPLAGQILRVGLMGASSSRNNVLLFLEALETCLARQGYESKANGARAAEQVYGRI
jgi:aspartate aminotransferase-like enzyme